MKDKKEKEDPNQSLPPPLEDSEKKVRNQFECPLSGLIQRRSSLTDTPITSSSSSEGGSVYFSDTINYAGMGSTDQACSSKATLRKKRKSQKKKISTNNSNSPTLHEMQDSKL